MKIEKYLLKNFEIKPYLRLKIFCLGATESLPVKAMENQ